MKKKVLTLCLVVALAATAIIGGTLAYFTDTDAQKNTFTTGNVAIDLFEDFGDNDKNGIEHLVPAVGSAQDGTIKNAIEKEVYVQNTGSEKAYVRVHIAIPSVLLNGSSVNQDVKSNWPLHFNSSKNSTVEGKWSWSNTNDASNWPASENDWNIYTTTIDNVEYTVHVVTYKTALYQNDTTVDAIEQVYLGSDVTNEDITAIKKVLGDNWYIYVAAEGAQAAGFDNAYDALNTAFGDPSDSNYTSKIDWKTVSGKTWVDTASANGK